MPQFRAAEAERRNAQSLREFEGNLRSSLLHLGDASFCQNADSLGFENMTDALANVGILVGDEVLLALDD